MNLSISHRLSCWLSWQCGFRSRSLSQPIGQVSPAIVIEKWVISIYIYMMLYISPNFTIVSLNASLKLILKTPKISHTSSPSFYPLCITGGPHWSRALRAGANGFSAPGTPRQTAMNEWGKWWFEKSFQTGGTLFSDKAKWWVLWIIWTASYIGPQNVIVLARKWW